MTALPPTGSVPAALTALAEPTIPVRRGRGAARAGRRPEASARAKDLGVINVANALPQVFAPFLATMLVTVAGGYVSLYLFSAAVCLAGSVLVYRIRGVR